MVRAGQAVERMVGNIKFHHAAPQLLEPLRLGADDHAFGDRRGAGCGVAVAPFHLDQAETAGTEALDAVGGAQLGDRRSEEHTSELQSLMRNSYAVFCLTKTNTMKTTL